MDRLMKLIGERRDVSFVVLPPPAEDTAPVTDAQVASWFEANKARYRAPETVSIEYVDVDSTALPEPAVADEAALRQRSEQEKARFVVPEQTSARNILIPGEPGTDRSARRPEKEKRARTRAEGGQPGTQATS